LKEKEGEEEIENALLKLELKLAEKEDLE